MIHLGLSCSCLGDRCLLQLVRLAPISSVGAVDQPLDVTIRRRRPIPLSVVCGVSSTFSNLWDEQLMASRNVKRAVEGRMSFRDITTCHKPQSCTDTLQLRQSVMDAVIKLSSTLSPTYPGVWDDDTLEVQYKSVINLDSLPKEYLAPWPLTTTHNPGNSRGRSLM